MFELPPAMTSWYATEHHPQGATEEPCFDVLGSMVYPAAGMLTGVASRPWYQLRDEFAYPVDAHPGGPSEDPEFRVEASAVYPADADPSAFDTRAWFEVRLRRE